MSADVHAALGADLDEILDIDAGLRAILGASVVECPTCGGPVRGLLATCRKPDCLRADLDAEMAHVRSEDD